MSDAGTIKDKMLPKGIPESHPSIGRDVRDSVTGPSWPETPDHGGGRMITRWHEAIWGLLLAVWVIYSRLNFISPYFLDPDAARLAFGVAHRLQGGVFQSGVFYQLEKTFGSFVVYEFLARIFGVDIGGLGHFMAVVNACFMIGIIVLSYFLGRMIWGQRVGIVSATVLSISPMMWITGEYPTTLVPALFFFMLAVWTMVMSYRVKGGRWWLVGSGILFAWSIIVRADMVLGMLVPVCYAFFVDRRGLRRALILYVIIFFLVAIEIGWLMSLGFSFMDVIRVGTHHPNYPDSLTLNWWGMGPFLFVMAFAGFVYRFRTDRKPLPFLFFWIVGFNSFYTGHLYSPGNFIAYYPVVSWLAAFSIIALYGWLVQKVRYNRWARIAFMVMFAMAALSMLTMSAIKEGDGKVRSAFGDYAVYTRENGSFPNGAVWFYMQEFRKGSNFQYGWAEDSAKKSAEEYFHPDTMASGAGESPIYIGNVSQVFLNYYLLTNGWQCVTRRGPFFEFQVMPPDSDNPNGQVDWSGATMETVFQGEEPVPELSWLTTPGKVNTIIGRDAIPWILDNESEVGSPKLIMISGWHVDRSFVGLDVLKSNPLGGRFDGTVECERELLEFFHTDPVPKYHVGLFDGGTDFTGKTVDVSGVKYLEGVTGLKWSAETRPGQWLVLGINYSEMFPRYRISVNGKEIEEIKFLARNLIGMGSTRWDMILISPEYISSKHTEFEFTPDPRGNIFDIWHSQRMYSDLQFREDVAVPLDLEYKNLECER